MAETKTLIDRAEIRDWAAARGGRPAINDTAASPGDDAPVLVLVFGQHAYADTDGPERAPGMGGPEQVDWDEWFRIFEERNLALVVSEEVPGQRDEFHEIVARGTR